LRILKIKISITYSAELVHKEPIKILSITVVKDIFFHVKSSFLIRFSTRLAVSKQVIYSRLKSNHEGNK